MKSVFEDVTLTYQGETFTVKHNRVMGLIEVVESHLTLEQIANHENQGIPRTKIAKAYLAALEYAGCTSATQEEIYHSLFDTDHEQIGELLNTITMMLVPPSVLQKSLEVEQEQDQEQEVDVTKKKPRARAKTRKKNSKAN